MLDWSRRTRAPVPGRRATRLFFESLESRLLLSAEVTLLPVPMLELLTPLEKLASVVEVKPIEAPAVSLASRDDGTSSTVGRTGTAETGARHTLGWACKGIRGCDWSQNWAEPIAFYRLEHQNSKRDENRRGSSRDSKGLQRGGFQRLGGNSEIRFVVFLLQRMIERPAQESFGSIFDLPCDTGGNGRSSVQLLLARAAPSDIVLVVG